MISLKKFNKKKFILSQSGASHLVLYAREKKGGSLVVNAKHALQNGNQEYRFLLPKGHFESPNLDMFAKSLYGVFLPKKKLLFLEGNVTLDEKNGSYHFVSPSVSVHTKDKTIESIEKTWGQGWNKSWDFFATHGVFLSKDRLTLKGPVRVTFDPQNSVPLPSLPPVRKP